MAYKPPKSLWGSFALKLTKSSHLNRSHSGNIQLFSSTCSSWNKQATYFKKSQFKLVEKHFANTCFYLIHVLLNVTTLRYHRSGPIWTDPWTAYKSGLTEMLYAVATLHLSCFLQQLFQHNFVQSGFRSQIYLLSINFSSPSTNSN